MSTIDVFREMTGVVNTSMMEISEQKARSIADALAEESQGAQSTAQNVALFPVSTYVSEAKPGGGTSGSSAIVTPKVPAFASHWAVIVGDINLKGSAMMYHLVLNLDKEGKWRARFDARSVDKYCEDFFDDTTRIQVVGETRYNTDQLRYIGNRMMDEFGDYQVIFWNCQMFAKCFLSVITRNEAVWTMWTSADVTNLFLFGFEITPSTQSRLKKRQRASEHRLAKAGLDAAESLSEEELTAMSESVIDEVCQAAIQDDVRAKKMIKDSRDKMGLIRMIWSMLRSQ